MNFKTIIIIFVITIIIVAGFFIVNAVTDVFDGVFEFLDEVDKAFNATPNGVGTTPLKKPCTDFNKNYRDDGTSCWLDSYGRGSGYLTKEACEKKHTDCVGGKKTTKFGIFKTLYYPKCKDGFKSVGCCICAPKNGSNLKVTLDKRQYCEEGKTLIAGLCYEDCPEGKEFTSGNFCKNK